MSYHVTILRTKNGVADPIQIEEVIAGARSIMGWHYVEREKKFVKEHSEGTLTLFYQNGELWTTNPEPWALEAMLELSSLLGARVRGDEFETYESTERSYLHPHDVSDRQVADQESELMLAASARQQRLIRIGIIGLFAALGVAGFVIGKRFEKR